MSKLKGLLLTEGLHGMISQVEGLAKALDLEYFHEKIELNSFWNFIPPNLTPISKFVFKNQPDRDFDIIISCGRKSVIPSIYLKKNSKKKIINIHIQNPKISFDKFDFIVAPDHDGLQGSNIYTSKGAIHYLTIEEINETLQLDEKMGKMGAKLGARTNPKIVGSYTEKPQVPVKKKLGGRTDGTSGSYVEKPQIA